MQPTDRTYDTDRSQDTDRTDKMERKIKYKETSITWMPQIPAHWEILRIKNLFQEVDERSETGDEELLSVSQYTGVTLKRENLENEHDHLTHAASLIGYKKVNAGNLIINIMGAWNGRLGISLYDGITSPSYCVYRIKGNNNPFYFGYLFRTNLFISAFIKNSTGIGTGYLRLYTDKFFGIYSFVPPKDEQDLIVRYIKVKDAKIDRFIQKKQRVIELLKEQRQCIISKSFFTWEGTNRQKKSNNIDWVRSAIKRLVKIKITDGPHESPVFSEEGIPFVSAEASCDGKIDLTKKRCNISVERHKEYCLKAKPQKGDLLMVKSGSTTGKIAIVDFDEEFSIWSPLALIRPNELVSNVYLFYFLCSEYFQEQVKKNWSFGTQPNIGMGKIEQLKIFYPEAISEQHQIVSRIKAETAVIDIAITKAEKEIALVKEYKEAMILEAVTGKIVYLQKNNQTMQTLDTSYR